MNAKNEKPYLSSEKIQSTRFLIWIISGLYLLPMVWFLLSHGQLDLRLRDYELGALVRLRRAAVNVRLWHIADMLNALTISPLLGAKRTVTNRCLPISIYEYTA